MVTTLLIIIFFRWRELFILGGRREDAREGGGGDIGAWPAAQNCCVCIYAPFAAFNCWSGGRKSSQEEKKEKKGRSGQVGAKKCISSSFISVLFARELGSRQRRKEDWQERKKKRKGGKSDLLHVLIKIGGKGQVGKKNKEKKNMRYRALEAVAIENWLQQWGRRVGKERKGKKEGAGPTLVGSAW